MALLIPMVVTGVLAGSAGFWAGLQLGDTVFIVALLMVAVWAYQRQPRRG